MALPKLGEKKNCETLIVAMPLSKQGEKKIVLAIVAMALQKMGKKKFVLAIVAMVLPKMEKKKEKDVTKSVKE